MVIETPHEQADDWQAILPWMAGEAGGRALSEQRAQLWALVLKARAIPCRAESSDAGWLLLMPPENLAAACHELRLFEEENRGWPPPAPPAHPLAENTLATISILILLATFHNIVQLDMMLASGFSPDWISIGNAQAAKILDGQWWRSITALTLHADELHLLSNLAIGGVFVILLCRELGSGLAWTLLLGAGAVGNLVNACVQSPAHSSVGASTAVFGAVGILAALSLTRRRHYLEKRWLLPVAAALALLALLGTEGKNTDLGAHLFGFISGSCLGLITGYLMGRRGAPGRLLNALLAFFSVALVVAAWWAAVLNG